MNDESSSNWFSHTCWPMQKTSSSVLPDVPVPPKVRRVVRFWATESRAPIILKASNSTTPLRDCPAGEVVRAEHERNAQRRLAAGVLQGLARRLRCRMPSRRRQQLA
eukprot:COSAG06_NODE_2148_length_7473_cov_28.925142_9_plen_107_part_00